MINQPGREDLQSAGLTRPLVIMLFLAVVWLFFTSDSTGAADGNSSAAFPSSIGGVLDRVGVSPPLGNQVPLDLEFTDASGQQIKLGDCFSGRPTILQLVYYQCPMLCRLSRDGLMGTLATINLKPGKDF